MIKHPEDHLLIALAFLAGIALAKSSEAKSTTPALAHAPLLSASIAGYTTPGSPDYPMGDAHYCGSALAQFERDISCAVIDTANGYAYFGTKNVPGLVFKVALGAGATTPTRVATLTLNEADGPLICAVIDPAAGYAYFASSIGEDRKGAVIIKVALGSGDNPPRRVAAIRLPPSETNLKCAVIDPAAGYAWFAGYDYGGWIVKVALGDGDNPPSRAGVTAVDTGNAYPASAVIDTNAGYAYIGTDSRPGRIIKLALPAAGLPRVIGTVTLAPGEDSLSCGVIDTDAGYAYFGTYTAYASVVKVALGTGDTSPTRVSSATLDIWVNNPYTAVIDPAAGYAYFANGGTVAKVALGAGAAAPHQVSKFSSMSSYGFSCSVIDLSPGAGYAYYGGAWPFAPGSVVKVALGAGDTAPSLVKALILPPLEDDFGSVALDTAAGYAYFGQTYGGGAPVCTIVKVAMSKGNEAPRRIGSATLPFDERGVFCGLIDSAAGYGYFGSDAKIIKVALGAGDAPPQRIGRLDLGYAFGNLTVGVLDSAAGYAYFCTNSNPPLCLKIALGAGATIPSLAQSVPLSNGDGPLNCGLINPAAGYAWFGTRGYLASTGRIVKVALGDGASAPRRVGALTLSDEGEANLFCAAFAPEAGFSWWGGQGVAVKVALGDGDTSPTRAGAVRYGNSASPKCVGIDPANGWAFFGPDDNPFVDQFRDAVVVKMPLDDRNTTFTSIPIPVPATYFGDIGCAAYDATTGHAYYASNFDTTWISKFMKFDLLSDGVMRRIGEIGMGHQSSAANRIALDTTAGYGYFAGLGDGGQNQLAKFSLGLGAELPGNITSATLDTFDDLNSSLLIDPAAGYLYQGAFLNHVVKIAAGAGANPPVRIGTLSLNFDDGIIQCGAIDPVGGYAYFGTTPNGNLIKVALGNGDILPRRASAANLTPYAPLCLVVDSSRGYIYGGSEFNPAQSMGAICKFAMQAGDTTPTLVSTLNLKNGDRVVGGGALDAATGYAYFCLQLGTSKLVKVALGEGDSTPRLIGAVTGTPDSENLALPLVDSAAGYGLFGATGSKMVKVTLGKGSDLPTRLGGISLNATGAGIQSAAIDPGAGYAYFGSYDVNDRTGSLCKVAYSHKNYIKASRIAVAQQAEVSEVRFYSHAAAGNLRLAIYSDTPAPALLWQSPSIPNAAENDWISAPIANGTLSDLTLQPGTYWLAWQTDSTADVPSYTRSQALRTGFRMDHLYGDFPAQIPATSATQTNELWSGYIVYSVPVEVGTVTIDATPSSASWQLTDGGGGNAQGTGPMVLNNVPAGTIRVDWLLLDGFAAPLPNPAFQALPPNGAITFTGRYMIPFDSLRAYLTGAIQTLTPAQRDAADVNRDGAIDVADLIALLCGRGL